MIEQSVARRAGTPDEVGGVAALLMGPDGTFITGSDFLMDGGVTATAIWPRSRPHKAPADNVRFGSFVSVGSASALRQLISRIKTTLATAMARNVLSATRNGRAPTSRT